MQCTSIQQRRLELRRGLTMPELLIASSIVAMMIAALATLAQAVDSGHEYSHGRSVATQHARVALERIGRNLNSAHANSEFPGFVVFREVVGTYSFPDTLVVWHPAATAADPSGLPQIGELVVYCANPVSPAELWEITAAGDTRSVPPLSDTTQWTSLLNYLKSDSAPQRTVVTDLLRTAAVSNGSGVSSSRGVLRFDVVQRPTDAQIQSYHDGDLDWNEIHWVQGIHGQTTGLRQAWCNVELQLMPGNWSAAKDPTAVTAIPFFTSGAIHYEVSQ